MNRHQLAKTAFCLVQQRRTISYAVRTLMGGSWEKWKFWAKLWEAKRVTDYVLRCIHENCEGKHTFVLL